jgi:hypothetical protein
MENKPLINSAEKVSKESGYAGTLNRIADAFNVKKNFYSMFHRPKGTYEALDGFRALAFLAVIVGHSVVH